MGKAVRGAHREEKRRQAAPRSGRHTCGRRVAAFTIPLKALGEKPSVKKNIVRRPRCALRYFFNAGFFPQRASRSLRLAKKQWDVPSGDRSRRIFLSALAAYFCNYKLQQGEMYNFYIFLL